MSNVNIISRCTLEQAHDYVITERGSALQRELVVTCRRCGHAGLWSEFYGRSQQEARETAAATTTPPTADKEPADG